MRLAIISDIHANLEALSATLAEIATVGVDRIICLGDIVGYNANPAECIALLRAAGAWCVAGNHDRAVAEQIDTSGFSAWAARTVVWTRRQLNHEALEYLSRLPLQLNVEGCLVAVHQALHPVPECEIIGLDSDERRRLSCQALLQHPSGARICAFGHTHQLGIYEFDGARLSERNESEEILLNDALYLLNPGTVGQPRSAERRATFLLLDIARKKVAIHRVAYNATATLAKARKAGLLPPLASVPAPLRSTLKWAARRLGVLQLRRHLQRARP